jgi:hypothetical protein
MLYRVRNKRWASQLEHVGRHWFVVRSKAETNGSVQRLDSHIRGNDELVRENDGQGTPGKHRLIVDAFRLTGACHILC